MQTVTETSMQLNGTNDKPHININIITTQTTQNNNNNRHHAHRVRGTSG
jgi:hypothetical protein